MFWESDSPHRSYCLWVVSKLVLACRVEPRTVALLYIFMHSSCCRYLIPSVVHADRIELLRVNRIQHGYGGWAGVCSVGLNCWHLVPLIGSVWPTCSVDRVH